MDNEPGKKIIILASFCISALCFFLNLASGGDFLYASFVAVCVMMVSALILLQIAKAIVLIMAQYLEDENNTARMLDIEEHKQNDENNF